MARFFIDRPIFAWVIALVIMLAGSLAIIKLPVAQYPSIAPPAVGISASYPGASAKTVEDSVTQIIEQNMTGLDHLLYMSSQSDSAGRVSVTLTFQPGTDPDIAQVQVQNKLQQAMSLLPQEVQQQGIRVQKTSSSFPDGRCLHLQRWQHEQRRPGGLCGLQHQGAPESSGRGRGHHLVRQPVLHAGVARSQQA